MKRIILVLTIALLGLTACKSGSKTSGEVTETKNELRWYDWNEGYKLAAKKNKLVLIDLYTDWCGWCKKMDRDTYTDKEVISTINKDFVAVKLNPEKTDMKYKLDTFNLSGYQMQNLLTNGRRTGFPTTVFFNPRLNQVLLAQAGYMDPENFKTLLNQVTSNKK